MALKDDVRSALLKGINAGEAHVWHTNLGSCGPHEPERYVSAEEAARAAGYRYESDARLFLVTRGLLRTALSCYIGCEPSEPAIEYREGGKPFVMTSGFRFSLSRSGDIALVAVMRGRDIGVDIESIRPAFQYDDIARRFFSPHEAACIFALAEPEKGLLFYRLWTRKEALLKATGEGLSGLGPGLDLFEAKDTIRNGKKWTVRDIDVAPGYSASLAVEGDVSDVKYVGYFS